VKVFKRHVAALSKVLAFERLGKANAGGSELQTIDVIEHASDQFIARGSARPFTQNQPSSARAGKLLNLVFCS
jgi:hypothetical protein